MIDSFQGQHRFLSNFYPVEMTINGITYPTAEHVYQAHKSKDLDIRKHVAKLERPGMAKSFGRTIDLREDWEEIKIPLMREILTIKFNNKRPELRNMLLNTLPYKLVEGNYWHDNFWGYCNCDKCAYIPHENKMNHLGRLLMEIRDNLTH
jgi:N-glycosidase YbiA